MKVLFVRFSSLGDIVLTTGIIKKFYEEFPESEISILTSSSMDIIFKDLKFVKKILTFERKSSFRSYINFLQDNISDFDYIIDLHSNLRSKFLKITSDATYISYDKNSFKRRLFVKYHLFKKDLNKTVLQRYFEPISKHFQINMPEIEDLRPFLTSENETEKNHIVIHPQASKKTKKWPKFNELTTKLIDNNYKVTIIGNIREEYDVRANNLTAKTNLKELIDVISTAEFVISTDSGPMHIASALNKKTIVVAGSTTKEFGFLPIFDNSKIIEINDLNCRPCHVHGLSECPKKHFKCMNDISVEMVINTVDKFND